MPNSPHAVSVALPRWQDVIGYEEDDPRVMSRLALGYPRFVINPAVHQLVRTVTDAPYALPFTSAETAAWCADFIRDNCGAPVDRAVTHGIHVISTTEAGQSALKAFWQHTGRILSSRQARAALEDTWDDSDGDDHRRALSEQVAHHYQCTAGDVRLYPTGMAAICAGLLAAKHVNPDKRTLQLGFPYVDTLKLQQSITGGVCFIPGHAGDVIEAAEAALARESFAACICEVPGNPLLGCIDILRLRELLDRHRVPLLIDDVVATPFNCALTDKADLVLTSLTKYMAGAGDVMGGAVIANPNSPFADALGTCLEANGHDRLWGADAIHLARLSADFPERMRVHNANGLHLAEVLRNHPAIEQVWYPKWTARETYDAIRRPEGGWGGLLSFTLKRAAHVTPQFFDRLELCKGPSLGTVFSLACPFTLLAHYDELDWAESCGVSRYLIRVSAGLEPPEVLVDRFEAALDPITT